MFTKLHDSATIPTRATEKSAGYDLHSLQYVFLEPNTGPILIKTGISVKIPEGHCGQIWGRSGLGRKGILVHGGLIDEDYEGEIGVMLSNHGSKAIEFEGPRDGLPGDKIAQIVFVPYYKGEDSVTKQRGTGGFGSTDLVQPIPSPAPSGEELFAMASI